MKKCIALFLFALIASGIDAKNLKAYFSYCAFEAHVDKNYIEKYLTVIGRSLNLGNLENGQRQGQIEVMWTIKSGDAVVQSDKYNLVSPQISKSDSIIPNFLDQQRFNLNRGTYTLELSIQDKNG